VSRAPRDLALRLVSLLLALGLWFVIAGRQTAERGLAVPVELRNVPRALELTGGAPDAVEVRVRASPGLIDTLDPGRVLATIDLAGAQQGEKIVQLTPEQIKVPFGFKVVRITPSLLTLQLESTRQRAIPVAPRIVGRPAAGYELSEVTSEPAEVQIAGPSSRVQAIASAFTEPISVEAASATVQQSVGVGLVDPLLRLEGGNRVRVTARVRETHETRVFEGLAVETQGGAALVEPDRASVVVSGPASQVRALDASALRLYVALTGQDPLPARLPVSVEIGSGHPGVAVVETRPSQVAVRPTRPRSTPKQ
jgi:YbbR domain-containing protein